MMRIKLESMFGQFGIDLNNTFGGNQVELVDDNITLKELLEILTEQSGGSVRFCESRSETDTHYYVVLLNGAEVSSLRMGLDTMLSDGDEVSIAPVDLMFSGG